MLHHINTSITYIDLANAKRITTKPRAKVWGLLFSSLLKVHVFVQGKYIIGTSHNISFGM